MTAMETIESFLQSNRGLAYCDDCLSKQLSITPRQHVQHKTSELALKPGFLRRVDVCAKCDSTNKLVISMNKLFASASGNS